MQQKNSALLILIAVVFVSILVMIIPTFGSKNISRVSLNKKLNLDLILNDDKDIKLIFFGYSACPDICSPRLEAINNYYKSIDKSNKNRIGVEFLDISSPIDKSLPQRYAEFFNINFKGIYLDLNILREYTKAFEVYFSKSLLNETEYDHTGNLYVVKKTNNSKYLRYIYNSYPYDFEQINKDIKGLLDESY